NFLSVGIDNPVFADTETQIFLPLLDVIALLRTRRDDFDNDFGNPRSPEILLIRGRIFINGHVGVPFRLQLSQEDFAVTASGNAMNSAGMLEIIGVQLSTNSVDLHQMTWTWDVGHENDSSTEFIEAPFLNLRMLELRQAHAPAVVGGADLDCL